MRKALIVLTVLIVSACGSASGSTINGGAPIAVQWTAINPPPGWHGECYIAAVWQTDLGSELSGIWCDTLQDAP